MNLSSRGSNPLIKKMQPVIAGIGHDRLIQVMADFGLKGKQNWLIESVMKYMLGRYRQGYRLITYAATVHV